MLLMNGGTTLERCIERIRHGNDAKLMIGELGTPKQGNADPQLPVLLRDAGRAQALAFAKSSSASTNLPNCSVDRQSVTNGCCA